MPLTKVPGSLIADDAITSAKIVDATIISDDFANTTITSAKMVLDPRDADNLNSGDVPAAQLGNVPQANLTTLQDDVALLGFKAAANGSLAKYNLRDQTVDAFEDASGVDAGSSTNEIRDSSGKYYSGAVAGTPPTGGTITTYTGYTVHSFTSTGNTNFVVSDSGNVDLLLVAGAGGGGGGYGNGAGGGGGAGGFRQLASTAVTAQTYVVTVGAGGAGGTYFNSGAGLTYPGDKGGNSSAISLSATGGGGGAGFNMLGLTGGSAGGSTNGDAAIAGNEGGYSPAEGFGAAKSTPGGNGGSGGGGASAEGATNTGSPARVGGQGGAGTANSWRTNSAITYAGGGSGGRGETGTGSTAGGSGGGGAGGNGASSSASNGADGTDGLGGGGGGAGHTGSTGNGGEGGDGGNGIVVIRYADGAFDTYNNMTLISNLTAAQAAPTKGDIVFTYTNGAGTAVLGTNITAEVSADNGSTWTLFSGLTSQGTTGGHTIVSAHDQTISSTITAPYNMKYRIKTLVQSAAMITRIQAVSLGWS